MDTALILQIAGVKQTHQSEASQDEAVTLLKRACVEDSSLLGTIDAQQPLVHQWLSFAASLGAADSGDETDALSTRLLVLNNNLHSRAFLCGPQPTIADFAVFAQLLQQRVSDAIQSDSHAAIFRFCNQMQRLALRNCARATGAATASVAVITKRSFSQNRASLVPMIRFAAGSGVPGSMAAAAQNGKAAATASPKPVPAAAAAPAPVAKGKAKAVDAAPPAAPVAAAPAADADPSKLDIRVGQVLRCWEHPESEKLLCEEIDLGEGAPRSIASGLRAFYSAAEVQGRRVLVLANLKERPMAGFKSQGMVLCASNADHSQVKLLEPPADAAVGDRVSFAGRSGEPATPAQMAKKKLLEQLAPQLRTNGDGVACWADIPFAVGATGKACTAPLPGAAVS